MNKECVEYLELVKLYYCTQTKGSFDASFNNDFKPKHLEFYSFCFVLYDLGLAKGSKRNISTYKLILTNGGNDYETTAIAYHIFEESIRYNLG